MSETAYRSMFDPASEERWDRDAVLPQRRTNMKVTLSHRLEAMIMSGVIGLSHMLGVDRGSGLFGRLIRFIGPKLKSVQKRGLANLALVYPENSKEDNENILRQVWENLGRTVAEYAHLQKFDAYTEQSRIQVEDREKLAALAESGQQVVFVSAHLANWELMAPVLYRAGVKFASVYRAANNPIVDEQIIKIRSKVTSRFLIPKNKRGSRNIVRSMNDGLSLCMLVDQKLNDGIGSPFMGYPAMTGPLTARLALNLNIPVVPIALVRKPHSAEFTFKLFDPIEFSPEGDKTSDILALTTKINEALEVIIKDNPGQWLWFHRRWPKGVQPKGAIRDAE